MKLRAGKSASAYLLKGAMALQIRTAKNAVGLRKPVRRDARATGSQIEDVAHAAVRRSTPEH